MTESRDSWTSHMMQKHCKTWNTQYSTGETASLQVSVSVFGLLVRICVDKSGFLIVIKEGILVHSYSRPDGVDKPD